MFLLKKIVAPFFLPLSVCLEILLLGLFFLWFTRRQKTGRILVSIGFLTLAAFSCVTVPDMLLRPLEYKYQPLLNLGGVRGVKWVVVLGGGHTSDPRLPPTSQLSEASLLRLAEGIRVHKRLPASKLILSGGAVYDTVPEAETLAGAALALGVERNELVLESESRDTEDEALLTEKIVGKDRFILVTSAAHMPRAMALFEKRGLKPVPAPTGYRVKKRQGITPCCFFPSSGALSKAEAAFYEYLGLAWARLRGQV